MKKECESSHDRIDGRWKEYVTKEGVSGRSMGEELC